MTIRLVLPIPPSANNLFVNGKRGRFKSPRYKNWEIEADNWFRQQKCNVVIGAFEVRISLPEMIRGDIDNRIKGVVDFIVAKGVVPDDKNLWRVSVERSADVPPGECHVTARAA